MKTNRRNLIKGLGALGLATMLPAITKAGSFEAPVKTVLPVKHKGMPVCWLTPAKTEGPYYFDANLLRQDIRYDTLHNNQFFDGIQLNMTFNIIDINCNPIPGVIVDIWHCNKDGAYSGYNGQPGGNWSGYNFMRGIQATDSAGQCSFITSYPGWYTGRATHIHFKVRLNSTTYVTSQFCFPDATNNAVYATPLYVAHGPNPITNAQDNIFNAAEPQYLTMYPVANGSGGYDAPYTIGINAPMGINDPGNIVEGYSLSQNYPNPFNPVTKIAYTIPKSSFVSLVIYDVTGKEVTRLVNTAQSAGTHEAVFDAGGLASGFYIYKIMVDDFTQTKDMLLIK